MDAMATLTGVEETIEVTSYAEVAEALRSPKLAVVLDEDSRAIRGGTVLRLDGAVHTRRRRLLNRLVLRDHHAVLRKTTLLPALERELARARGDRRGDDRARPRRRRGAPRRSRRTSPAARRVPEAADAAAGGGTAITRRGGEPSRRDHAPREREA